jgi:hypothetical protein
MIGGHLSSLTRQSPQATPVCVGVSPREIRAIFSLI